jgi:hypothetical protein
MPKEVHAEEGGKKHPVRVLGTCTAPLPIKAGGPPVPCPLALAMTEDVYGNSVYLLLYSDHEGPEALDPWVRLMLGELQGDDKLKARKQVVLNVDLVWAMPSVRLADLREAAKVGKGEFVWNTYKSKPELAALVRAGVLEFTGKTVNQAYYQNLPVVRLKPQAAAAPKGEAPTMARYADD